MKKKYPINHKIGPGWRAGKPRYSFNNLHYPSFTPSNWTDAPEEQKKLSYRVAYWWHLKRRTLYYLGYIMIDGKKSDESVTWDEDKILKMHRRIDRCDEKLKELKKEWEELTHKQNEDLQQGILSEIWEQTQTLIEKKKEKP